MKTTSEEGYHWKMTSTKTIIRILHRRKSNCKQLPSAKLELLRISQEDEHKDDLTGRKLHMKTTSQEDYHWKMTSTKSIIRILQRRQFNCKQLPSAKLELLKTSQEDEHKDDLTGRKPNMKTTSQEDYHWKMTSTKTIIRILQRRQSNWKQL